jgi:hypothetical protein
VARLPPHELIRTALVGCLALAGATTTWFLGRVKDIHGVDLAAPMTGSPSELAVDSDRAAALARQP